jgi:hypothetical protein
MIVDWSWLCWQALLLWCDDDGVSIVGDVGIVFYYKNETKPGHLH